MDHALAVDVLDARRERVARDRCINLVANNRWKLASTESEQTTYCIVTALMQVELF